MGGVGSVCGVAVFNAPMGRSFAAWQAETEQHGWPSFRDEEVVKENMYVPRVWSIAQVASFTPPFPPPDMRTLAHIHARRVTVTAAEATP